MFKSHLVSMTVFALVVSVLLAFIRHDDKREIMRTALRLFIFMVGGVILFSWVMYLF
jgi:uncharacterized membrane protein